MAAATVVRLYGLDAQSLWNDELASIRRSSYASVQDVIVKGTEHDVHPPGYYVILHYAIRYLGDSEIAVRLPSAAAGIISVLLIYWLGALLGSSKGGLIAAVLTAFTWAPVFYSQDARAYSLLLTGVLGCSCLLVLLIRCPCNRRVRLTALIASYWACALLTSYLHYFGALFVGLHGLLLAVMAVRRPVLRVRWVAIYLPIGLAYLPWAPFMARTYAAGSIWIPEPEPTGAARKFLLFLFSKSDVLVIGFLAVSAVLARDALRRHMSGEDRAPAESSPGQWMDAVLVAWLVIPFVTAFILSKIGPPILTPRNLIISAPAAYLLFGRGLERFMTTERISVAIAGALTVGLTAQLVLVLDYYDKPDKDQFREAAAFVVSRTNKEESAMVIACAWSPFNFNYYFKRHDSALRVSLQACHENDVPKVLQAVKACDPAEVWLVWGHRDLDPGIREALTRHLSVSEAKQFFSAGACRFSGPYRP